MEPEVTNPPALAPTTRDLHRPHRMPRTKRPPMAVSSFHSRPLHRQIHNKGGHFEVAPGDEIIVRTCLKKLSLRQPSLRSCHSLATVSPGPLVRLQCTHVATSNYWSRTARVAAGPKKTSTFKTRKTDVSSVVRRERRSQSTRLVARPASASHCDSCSCPIRWGGRSSLGLAEVHAV